MRRVVILVVTLVAIVGVLLFLVMSPSSQSTEHASPDHQFVARNTVRLIGNSFSTPEYVVEIRRVGWLEGLWSTTIFQCSCETIGNKGIDVEWQSANSLVVTLNGADGKVIKRAQKFDSVDIQYQP